MIKDKLVFCYCYLVYQETWNRDLGKEAYEFVDLSAQAGFSIWQILPLNPSSSGNSPYTPYSSFAGDEIYISLELLKDWHLLDEVPNYLQDLKELIINAYVYLKIVI